MRPLTCVIHKVFGVGRFCSRLTYSRTYSDLLWRLRDSYENIIRFMLIWVCPSRPPSNFGFSLFPCRQKCVQVCDAGRRTSILKIYRIGFDPRPESQTNPDNGQNLSILKSRKYFKINPYKTGQRNKVCASTAVYVLVGYRRYYRERLCRYTDFHLFSPEHFSWTDL